MKNKNPFLKIWGLSFVLVLSGCTKVGLATLNGAATFKPHYTRHKNIIFDAQNNLALDIYSPVNTKPATPVVLFFYGGSWQSGSKDQYKFMGEALSTMGFIAVIADYRTYPTVKFPEFVDDAAKALAFTHNEIKNFTPNAASDKIFLMGHSAGAHIAALLTYNPHYLKANGLSPKQHIAGFIGLAGPYDFLPFTNEVFKDIFGPPQNYAQSQPIYFIKGNEPKSFLLYGQKDTTVWPQNIVNLEQKIKNQKGQVQTKIYPTLNHVTILTGFSSLLKNKELYKDIQTFILKEAVLFGENPLHL